MGVLGRGAAMMVAASVARVSFRAIADRDLATGQRLLRQNHRHEPVTLAQGPAAVLGAAAGIAAMSGLSRPVRWSGLLAVVGTGAFGLLDDVQGTATAKGLKGHLAALRSGHVTTGALKVAGIGATALLAGPVARAGRGGVTDAALAAVLIAGSANALNLFDLRPGRATKVFLAVAGPSQALDGGFGDLLAGPVGAATALLPDDLAERSMLGDTGANALGALVGTAAAATLNRRGLAGTAAGVVAITLLSERVSFTSVIERTPVLRSLDRWGRRST